MSWAGDCTKRWMKVAVALAALAVASGGCAIHTQGPIKEVAYDFTDHAFYDRAYAVSPAYEDGFVGAGAPLVAPSGVVATQAAPAAGVPAATVLVPPPPLPGDVGSLPAGTTSTRVLVGHPPVQLELPATSR